MYFAPSGPKAEPVRITDADRRWPLTKRETEILRYAADGRSNLQVAKILWVTEPTVKFHLSNIYRKLGVTNRTEASLWAIRTVSSPETPTPPPPEGSDGADPSCGG